MLRGKRVDTIDLGDWFSHSAIEQRPGDCAHDYPWGMFPAEVGKRYLILAQRTALGPRRVSMLVPENATGGVFALTSNNTAVSYYETRKNKRVKVNLNDLAQRLKGTLKSR
jgi:hypothetical protein